jgi:hypothetical protein
VHIFLTGAMKIVTYKGQEQSMPGVTDALVITPADLAAADVVLTTYEATAPCSHLPLTQTHALYLHEPHVQEYLSQGHLQFPRCIGTCRYAHVGTVEPR